MKTLSKLTILAAATLLGFAKPAPALEAIYPELMYFDEHIDGTSGELWGYDIAFDGEFLAIAAPNAVSGGERRGAIYIYRRGGSPLNPSWSFIQEIDGNPRPRPWNGDPAHHSYFGYAITIEDGFLIVGQRNYGIAPIESNLDGVVNFYQWVEASGQFVDASGHVGPGSGARMGTSVSLSGDRFVAGAFSENAVYTYELRSNGWNRDETISKPAGAGSFGDPVLFGTQTVCMDGDLMVIGAPRTTSNKGAAYAYRHNGSSWALEGTLGPVGSGALYFGDSVAIRGETLAIAAASGSSNGAVYVYERGAASWGSSQQLVHSATDGNSRLGMAGIALSEDGRALFATSNDGLVYAWKKVESGAWIESPPFSPNGAAAFGGFGNGISMRGSTLCVAGGANRVHLFEYDDSNAPFLAGQLRAQLYHDDAVANPRWEAPSAAFRYKKNLFERVTLPSGAERVQRADGVLASYFGAAEEARVDAVLADLETRLDKDPLATAYQDLYLDIVYDKALVDQQRAHDELVGLDLARIADPPVNGKVIDNEIALYQASLSTLRNAIKTMVDSLDADIAWTPDASPAGFHFFKTRVPARALMPVSFLENGVDTALLDGDGQPITAPLASGYRDALLFFEMLGEYGCSTSELARLHYLKDDVAAAEGVLQGARELVFVQGSIVRGMFRNPVTGDDPAALEGSLAAWEQGLADLAGVEDSAGNGLNPLGYDEDFLVLLQRADGDDSGIFNTYDILDARFQDTGFDANYLQRAKDDLFGARTDYANYRGGLDQLSDGLIAVNGDAELRLSQIVGIGYGQPGYDDVPSANGGADGGFVQGSEMWDQFQNIRRARLQIERNGQEMRNIEEKVRIESERADTISNIRVDYAGQRSELAEEVGRLNAAQAYTEVLAQAANPANWLQVGLNAVNAGVQVYGELRKGEIEAERERMAGQEEADVIAAESEALIATMLLDMKTLVISSQENAIILQQEVGRLVGLMRERETLERRIEAHRSELESRYYADPSHQLRYLNAMIKARGSFERAQGTVFLMARALEYKWNTPFDTFLNGQATRLNDIFCARNALELQDIVDDMRSANATNIPSTEHTSVFSLKEDAFGYVEDGSLYPDPISGAMVSATQAFRSLLEKEFLVGDPASFALLEIPFSTVRDPLQSFFGPDFYRGSRLLTINPDGTRAAVQGGSSKGRYLDKIIEVGVTMPGDYGPGPVTTSSELYYGGTNFLRTRTLGRYEQTLDASDPESELRFDRLTDEITAVPTRASTFLNGNWQTTNQLLGNPTVGLTQDVWPSPPVAPSSWSQTFRERSVACNGWEISITLKNGPTFAEIAEITDVLLHFRHQSSPRG